MLMLAARPPTPHILIVDDLLDNILLLQTLLETEGYSVSAVDNGEAALAQIRSHPPDLLLLDVMMPGLTGYDVTRQIRSNQQLSALPIVLVTAHEAPEVMEGLKLGANAFVRKPIDLDRLLTLIEQFVRQ